MISPSRTEGGPPLPPGARVRRSEALEEARRRRRPRDIAGGCSHPPQAGAQVGLAAPAWEGGEGRCIRPEVRDLAGVPRAVSCLMPISTKWVLVNYERVLPTQATERVLSPGAVDAAGWVPLSDRAFWALQGGEQRPWPPPTSCHQQDNQIYPRGTKQPTPGLTTFWALGLATPADPNHLQTPPRKPPWPRQAEAVSPSPGCLFHFIQVYLAQAGLCVSGV